VVGDSWFVVGDSWFVVGDSWFVVGDSWFVVGDSWFVDNSEKTGLTGFDTSARLLQNLGILVGSAFHRRLRTAMERRPYQFLQLPRN